MGSSVDRGELLGVPVGSLDVQAERLMDAARGQLIEFGLRRTSLDAVARAAGLGRATLFRRFPSRDALLGALVAREAQRGISFVDQRVAGIDDPDEFLIAGVVAVIHAMTGDELLQRLLVTDPEQMLPLLAGRGAPVIAMGREYVAGQLRRIERSGAVLTGDPEMLAELLARVVLSLAVSPEGVLPLDDDAALEKLARSTFVPMVLTDAGRRR
jgi:AcrR family transcriptional regulator